GTPVPASPLPTSPYLETAPLQPGDTVRLIAPSGPSDEESLVRAIAQLESWGLTVVPGEHIRARHPRVTYLAGTDEQRRTDLVDAWCDTDTDAVIALRGGYGAMRLLDGIDFDLMRRHMLRRDGRPKLLTGSSDITAFHQAWDHHLSAATLFCPMVGNDPFKNSSVVPDEVASWLFAPWGGRELGFPAAAAAGAEAAAGEEWSQSDTFGSGKSPNATSSFAAAAAGPRSRARTLVPGRARGRLGGGNLSLVAAGIGSPELAGLRERRSRSGPNILMLEDVDEELYRLDNLLMQTVRAGWFDSADAVVLGSWEDCAPVAEVEALIMDCLGEAGIPIVTEMGFGHDPHAPSLPLGVDATLEAPAGGRPRLWVDPRSGGFPTETETATRTGGRS